LMQFLLESLALCVAGGALGCAAGIGGALLMERMGGYNIAVSPGAVGLAFGFSAAVGVFFGMWPARRAALLDPIVSLRHEWYPAGGPAARGAGTRLPLRPLYA